MDRGDWVRQALGVCLNGVFIVFVLVVVGTYGWVSFNGLYDVADKPINAERFNQIWTSLSGIVGAIVGWMIRELTSGNSEEASVMRERGKHIENDMKTKVKIDALSRDLQEKKAETVSLQRKIDVSEEELSRVNDEIRILGALKSELPEDTSV